MIVLSTEEDWWSPHTKGSGFRRFSSPTMAPVKVSIWPGCCSVITGLKDSAFRTSRLRVVESSPDYWRRIAPSSALESWSSFPDPEAKVPSSDLWSRVSSLDPNGRALLSEMGTRRPCWVPTLMSEGRAPSHPPAGSCHILVFQSPVVHLRSSLDYKAFSIYL